MDIQTLSAAIVLTINFSKDELSVLDEAAKRENVSLEKLVKDHLLSICEGVNTPGRKANDSKCA